MAINKLTDRELKERIGVSQKSGITYPLYTIEGRTFSTSQTRRRVPTKTRVKGVKYWYTTFAPQPRTIPEDVLAQMVAYVEAEMKPKSASAKDSK